MQVFLLFFLLFYFLTFLPFNLFTFFRTFVLYYIQPIDYERLQTADYGGNPHS